MMEIPLQALCDCQLAGSVLINRAKISARESKLVEQEKCSMILSDIIIGITMGVVFDIRPKTWTYHDLING
jgi:hypothetical protein